MAELRENVLVSCIIDFDDIQLCLRQYCLNLNICKVMTIFFKFWPKKIRKTVARPGQPLMRMPLLAYAIETLAGLRVLEALIDDGVGDYYIICGEDPDA